MGLRIELRLPCNWKHSRAQALTKSSEDDRAGFECHQWLPLNQRSAVSEITAGNGTDTKLGLNPHQPIQARMLQT